MDLCRILSKFCHFILLLSLSVSPSRLATQQSITTTTMLPGSCDIVTKERAICTGNLPDSADLQNVKFLELYRIDNGTLNIDGILEKCPYLRRLSIENGDITEIVETVTNNQITHLKLVNLRIRKLPTTFLNKFKQLKILNLQNNHLKLLPTNLQTVQLKEIHLSGNHWNCSEDLSWILNINPKLIKDLNNMTCFNDPYNNKEILPIAKIIKNMNVECPELCTCTLPKIVRNPESDNLEPIIHVNCSYRDLNEMPQQLPIDTKILHLENNNIDNIQPLVINPIYRKINDIYLDNNQINSIEILEGSYWLRHFRIFSIRGNRVSELPTYALDNALLQNPNMPDAIQMYFGNNPWRCDCVFTPVFQEMLQKFAPQIEDVREIRCTYVEGDKNSKLPIIDLSRSSVCRLPSEYSIQALDLVNGILASLIVLILGKLAYDYYYFKKTGRLPWIVTKMP